METEPSVVVARRLRSATEFRFAFSGVGSFQFNNFEMLEGFIENPALIGLFVNEELFRMLEIPPVC
jgi:hypothetical protein